MNLKKILIKNLEGSTELESPADRPSKRNKALTMQVKQRQCCNTNCGRTFTPIKSLPSDYCSPECRKNSLNG